MVSEERIAELRSERALAEVISYETDEVVRQAQGGAITAYDGKVYLDFTSGVAVQSCGYSHPEIVGAIVQQAQAVTHTADVMRHVPQMELAELIRETLAAAAPGTPPWTTLFLNSGSEAVDAAVKLVVKATGRTHIAAFSGAFHGRTILGTMLSRSKRIHFEAYEPFLAALSHQVHHAPAPRCAGCDLSGARPCCAHGLERIMAEHGSEIAAVILEPVQGEGGFAPFSAEAGQTIAAAAREAGALVIVDEVQTGWGRTGRWFGFEHLGIVPDLMVFGKAVGGGLPLSGIAAPDPLMRLWKTGEHGTTFGGNPVSCAAGLAALRTIVRDGLVARAAEQGARLLERARGWEGRWGVFQARGRGLMIGIELRDSEGRPNYARTAAVKSAAEERGLLILTCGARLGDPDVDNSTIRLLPPLNLSEADLDRGMDILEESLQATP